MVRKIFMLFLLCNSLNAMEWDTRCFDSYELWCCSLVSTLASSDAIAEGIIQPRFPQVSLIDQYMGRWAVSPSTKLKTGIGIAALSALCSTNPNHSCLWGNLHNYSQSLVRRILGCKNRIDSEKKLN